MRPDPDPRPYYRSLAPLLVWQQVPRPVDWSAVFGRRAPLALEIGIGNGEFLTRTAAANPRRDHVGIDLRWASVKRALRNLAKADVSNARVLIEDARPVVERMFGARSLEQVFLLFPCPWRKEKHAHHRLLQRSFLELVNHRLIDGGELLLVTDWAPLLEWTLAQIPGTGLRPDVRTIEPRFDTKYERKWSSLGQQRFHELRLIKFEHRDAPATEDLPVNPPRLSSIDLDRFRPQDLTGAPTITFKEIVRDRERGVAMVRTVVVEEPLTQQFWITVARDAQGTWWVVPARGCATLPTAGVQRALERVAECGQLATAAASAS
jgi:tRNA (guanine-N7-)-methyltransferase